MKVKSHIVSAAIIAVSIAMPAQAKAKPQTPPPVAGSCKLDKGIWIGHCQTVPPIKKIPTSPKPSKPEKAK